MEDNITDEKMQSNLRIKIEGSHKDDNSFRRERKKNSIMLKNYYNNLYQLENQALVTGFGKMINAKNQTNPKYSFGREKRFFTIEKRDDLPYLHETLEDEKYGNVNIGYHNHKKGNETYSPKKNKLNNTYNSDKERLNTINFVSGGNAATDYYYMPPPTHIYKFPKLPRYSFGKDVRGTAKTIKTYDYYKLSYDKKTDLENIEKRWRKHIIGGDIGVDERFIENRKLYNETLTPGPGRYNPNYNYFKYKQNKYGYMGIKIRDEKLRVSTEGPKTIQLTPYNIQYLIGTNDKKKRLNKSLKHKFIDENMYKNIIDRKNFNFATLREKKETSKNLNSNNSLNKNEN